MSKVIMVGCDLHDRSMLLRYAVGTAQPQQLSFENNRAGRTSMIARLRSMAQRHGAKRIVFAYEASGLGHGLSDQLNDEAIEGHVLSPTHLPKTPKNAKLKTDARDAQMLLEQVRGYVLAGNALPVVWTPPQRLRDDRELVRARVDLGDEITRTKLRIDAMFKRYELKIVSPTKKKWTKGFIRYVRQQTIPTLDLAVGTRLRLLLDRLDAYLKERSELDKAIKQLSQTDRYRRVCAKLREIPGVGLLVAMTFLTEMGDLTRFHNRREVAAYLGLCPSSNESGETNDRKGRITRQGPARLRKVLCQAAWYSIGRCEEVASTYHRIRQDQKKRAKKAIVALMRKLGIQMWHRGLARQDSRIGTESPRDAIESPLAGPKSTPSRRLIRLSRTTPLCEANSFTGLSVTPARPNRSLRCRSGSSNDNPKKPLDENSFIGAVTPARARFAAAAARLAGIHRKQSAGSRRQLPASIASRLQKCC